MRNTIYLVRHAEADSNTNPHHIGEAYLTEQGVVQSKQLANQLRDKGIEYIYVSNILRAQLTADEISNSTERPIVELSFLKERKGSYSSKGTFIPEESFGDMTDRVTEARLFLENHMNGKLVVVSHAIFIKNFLANIMIGGVLDESIIFKIEDTLVIDNAAVSKLVFNKEKKKWRVMYLNSAHHLNDSVGI